jgi:hypothetical protein
MVAPNEEGPSPFRRDNIQAYCTEIRDDLSNEACKFVRQRPPKHMMIVDRRQVEACLLICGSHVPEALSDQRRTRQVRRGVYQSATKSPFFGVKEL